MHARHLESVGRRFSAGAATYARHTHVQREAAAHLAHLIPNGPFMSIFEPGCGTGHFTRLLRARWPAAHIEAVDAAPGMIARAHELNPADPHIRWAVADATAPGDGAAFDLIASNCALHWTLDLPGALRRLAQCLGPGGILAASLMLHGTFRELQEARAIAAPHKLPRAQLPTRERTETALQEAGLTITHVEERSTQTLFAHSRAFLRALHDQGVTGGWISQSQQPLTRGELARLCDVYQAAQAVGTGEVQATYRVGYFIAEHL